MALGASLRLYRSRIAAVASLRDKLSISEIKRKRALAILSRRTSHQWCSLARFPPSRSSRWLRRPPWIPASCVDIVSVLSARTSGTARRESPTALRTAIWAPGAASGSCRRQPSGGCRAGCPAHWLSRRIPCRTRFAWEAAGSTHGAG